MSETGRALRREWRVGSIGGRMRAIVGPVPDGPNIDMILGTMKTPELATEVVRCVNAMHDIEEHGREVDRRYKQMQHE